MTDYGVTPLGFSAMPMSVIVQQRQDAYRAVFGANLNFNPWSVISQFVAIESEREALACWQLGEAIALSGTVGGAEGTAVDNLLALNNLRRQLATPTRTNPNPVTGTNGITLYGLLLGGTPGTVVLAGSTIQTTATPPVEFTTDATVTIAAAVNAAQNVFMSNTPNAGALQLSIVDASGNTLTMPAFPYNALPGTSQLSFSAVPAASTSFELVLTQAGAALTTAPIATNGAYPTAAAIQAAIQALAGYGSVTVTGAAGSYQIVWGAISNPLTTVASNTTTVTITPLDSIQSGINNLLDSEESVYPYTDVVVTAATAGYLYSFGAGTPVGSNPPSGAQPQPLMQVVSNTLMSGISVTNVAVVTNTQGAPAQVPVTATCASGPAGPNGTGPNFVAAGAISVIGTPVGGWASVTNQLDCLTGTSVQDDTEAMVYRQNELQAEANGPLDSIIEKVSLVTGVTAVIGFQNLNEAALQVVSFPIAPSSGSFKLVVGSTPTSAIPYNASAGQVQTAIRGVSGFGQTVVTGDIASGFTVDFNGSLGGQPQPLMGVVSNTTGGAIVVAFGRPGKSFEIVVEGGDQTTIAQTILGAAPAGIQSYGSTTVTVFDAAGNPFAISFSRPTQVPIYVVLALETDLTVAPQPQFNPATIATIQQDIADAINEVGIGGLVKGFGTNGIIGCFNAVPGILDYTLYFGRTTTPTTNTPVQMQPEEAPIGETFNVAVSYT